MTDNVEVPEASSSSLVPGAAERKARLVARRGRVAALVERGNAAGDEVMRLFTQRFRLWEDCERRYSSPQDEDAFDALVSETNELSHALDEQIVETVATSPAGIIAQVELLAQSEHPLADDDEMVDRLVASIMSGLLATANEQFESAGCDPGEADGALFATEREITTLRARAAALAAAGDRGDHPEISDRVWQLEEEIATTAPTSLAGAAVKLRRLADPDVGIEAGPTADDPGSIRQVLEVVESLLGKADGQQFLAAEREVAEANRLAQAAADDQELQPILWRYNAATAFVEGTEPRSMVAAIVKLRQLLCEQTSPLAGYDAATDSLRQVVDFMERVVGLAIGQAPSEPAVIGFGELES
jgi:hypothetical protein